MSYLSLFQKINIQINSTLKNSVEEAKWFVFSLKHKNCQCILKQMFAEIRLGNNCSSNFDSLEFILLLEAILGPFPCNSYIQSPTSQYLVQRGYEFGDRKNYRSVLISSIDPGIREILQRLKNEMLMFYFISSLQNEVMRDVLGLFLFTMVMRNIPILLLSNEVHLFLVES